MVVAHMNICNNIPFTLSSYSARDLQDGSLPHKNTLSSLLMLHYRAGTA